MHFGTPPWKADLFPSLFASPMERNLHRVQSSSAQTQIARIAKPSRRTGFTCFTVPSSGQSKADLEEESRRFLRLCWLARLILIICAGILMRMSNLPVKHSHSFLQRNCVIESTTACLPQRNAN